MASGSLNEENVEKRLMSVTNSQDSIQSLSLWIIHHKTHHTRIAELWYKIMKKSGKPSHRLTLFYLCNDVVQNCKRKKVVVFRDTFRPFLKQATALVRDASIKGKVERIFNIWEERHVYDPDFVAHLKAILDRKRGEDRKRDEGKFRKPFSPKEHLKARAKERVRESRAAMQEQEESFSPLSEDLEDIQPPDPAPDPGGVKDDGEDKDKDDDDRNAPSEETLAVFKPSELIDKMKVFKRQEAEMEFKVRQLSHLKLDASSIEAVKQLKDRAHGNEFSTQFEDSCVRLEEAMKCLEKKKGEQRDLLGELHVGEYFYDQQFREAKIVANAYKNYGSRINTMKRRLDELMRVLPSPSPPLSPPAPGMDDAPSPGNTPPEEELEGNFAASMEEVQDNSALNAEDDAMPSPPEEALSPVGSSPGDPATQDTGMYRPAGVYRPSATQDPGVYRPASVYRPAATQDPGSLRLENRLASFLPSLHPVSSALPFLTDVHTPLPAYLPHPITTTTTTTLTPTPTTVIHTPTKTPTQNQSPFPQDDDDEGGSTPLTDEQPSTPVQDEDEELSPPPPPPPVEAKKENPIDFLSRLISQTQRTKAGGEGGMNSTSSFLESFTRLTSKVKEHIGLSKTAEEEEEGEEEDEEDDEDEDGIPGPKSWAAWKKEKASSGGGDSLSLPTPPPPPMPSFGLPPLPPSPRCPCLFPHLP
ncbi:hypothetical protein ACOMHN_022828 [Nucella lapillus]